MADSDWLVQSHMLLPEPITNGYECVLYFDWLVWDRPHPYCEEYGAGLDQIKQRKWEYYRMGEGQFPKEF